MTRDSDWLTVKDTGADVKCGVKLVYRAVKRGDLRAARLGGAHGALRIHRDWVREWLERCATPVEVRRRG